MDNGALSYRRFLDGDESAFDIIIKEYFDNLIFFINRYVHDLHISEDIAIDVFADLVVHKNRYNFRGTLKTYLFMLAKSRTINYAKRQIKRRAVEESYTENENNEYESLESLVLHDELKLTVNKAVDKLPEDMKVAIHLIYFENLTYEEAAAVMGKNKKQIDNLLYRAKNTLRTMLGKEDLLK